MGGDPEPLCIHPWHEHWVVIGPDGDPLGITAAEGLRVGQVGGESVTFALTRLWQTDRRPPESGCPPTGPRDCREMLSVQVSIVPELPLERTQLAVECF